MPAPRVRLHILTLSSFAIAQPLYDLIGRNPEFLVAHGAGPWTVAALVAMLSLGIPLILIAAADALNLLSPRTGAALQRGIVASLAGLVAAGGLRDAPPALALSLVALTVAIAAFAYRLAVVQAFLTIVSLAVPIFPLVFVLATPVARIVSPSERARVSDAAPGRRPPIVVVVFDELGTFPLLDDHGEIDAQRFPNFASLARRATWFPNAVAAFPYTEQALPAIVTGVHTDRAERRLMIAGEYPNNLFTWLGTSYPLHVSEPISRLCPAALCTSRTATDARGLISDVAVLYLHLVVPHTLADKRLPSLAFKWKNLAGEPASEVTAVRDEVPADGFNKAREVGRGELFRRFIEGIEPGPVLHFAHALLPHDPYVYLPSGRQYSRGSLAVGLTSNRAVWSDDAALIEIGWRQHVAQVGFVDTLLGELVARLESRHLFDRALVIITSDHGSAFLPGMPHRDLTEANYREIVATPMFVKLPYQTAGRVDLRRASALDVVPTIADIVGVHVPWRTDGRSILSADFPDRGTLTYAGTGVAPLRPFDVREHALTIKRRAPAEGEEDSRLVGTRVHELDGTPAAAGLQVLSEGYFRLQAVPANRSFVPVLIEGRIEQSPPSTEPLRLAIALNGVIHAVTRTRAANGAAHYFATMVPESAVRAGANTLDVLAVEGSFPQVRLARIASQLGDRLEIARGAAGDELVMSGERRLLGSPRVIGFVDRIDDIAGGISFHGWAVDAQAKRELRVVVAFSGGRAIAFAYPEAPRPDVTASLDLPQGTRVAYLLEVARHDVATQTIRLFGISRDGVAGELNVSGAARQVLTRLRGAPAGRK